MDEKIVTFKCGAKSSCVTPAYHKIPQVALRRIAQRFTEGGERYDDPGEANKISGKQNWHLGDAEFFIQRFNHAMEHIGKFADGDRSEDHLAAGAWGLIVLMWAQERGIIE